MFLQLSFIQFSEQYTDSFWLLRNAGASAERWRIGTFTLISISLAILACLYVNCQIICAVQQANGTSIQKPESRTQKSRKDKHQKIQERPMLQESDRCCVLLQLHELIERLREREDRAGSGGAATANSSCGKNGGDVVGEEAEDDKRNVVLGCVDMDPPESCVLGGAACATPADVSVESECDDHHHHHLDYDDGFPESFCATPELWEPWPLVEWNAVA